MKSIHEHNFLVFSDLLAWGLKAEHVSELFDKESLPALPLHHTRMVIQHFLCVQKIVRFNPEEDLKVVKIARFFVQTLILEPQAEEIPALNEVRLLKICQQWMEEEEQNLTLLLAQLLVLFKYHRLALFYFLQYLCLKIQKPLLVLQVDSLQTFLELDSEASDSLQKIQTQIEQMQLSWPLKPVSNSEESPLKIQQSPNPVQFKALKQESLALSSKIRDFIQSQAHELKKMDREIAPQFRWENFFRNSMGAVLYRLNSFFPALGIAELEPVFIAESVLAIHSAEILTRIPRNQFSALHLLTKEHLSVYFLLNIEYEIGKRDRILAHSTQVRKILWEKRFVMPSEIDAIDFMEICRDCLYQFLARLEEESLKMKEGNG